MSNTGGNVIMDDRNKGCAFLEKNLVSKEPFGQYKAWFDEASAAKEILDPRVMCLATATKNGIPSARYVLCKCVEDGFVFFTDTGSRKIKEIEANSYVAGAIYHEVLNRAIRIEGKVEQLSDEETARDFEARPVPIQLSVAACNQSTPVDSRDTLVARKAKLEAEYLNTGKSVPKPDYWVGYIIRATAVEFFQGQPDRLSDRIRFRKPAAGEVPDGKLLHAGENGWVYERLSP